MHMNNITQYTLAFWFNILIANLWLMNDELLLALVFGIGAGLAWYSEYIGKDSK